MFCFSNLTMGSATGQRVYPYLAKKSGVCVVVCCFVLV